MNFTLPSSYSLKAAHRDKQCWCEKGMPLLQLEIFLGVNKLQNGYKYEAFKITKSITKFWLQLRKQINCTQKLFRQDTSSFTKCIPLKTLLYWKLFQPNHHYIRYMDDSLVPLPISIDNSNAEFGDSCSINVQICHY